jgi:mono/diheme cytochrome c family protein
MKSTSRLLLIGLVLGAGIAACSDDSEPGNSPDGGAAGSGGGTAGTAGSGGTGGSSTGGAGGAGGSTGGSAGAKTDGGSDAAADAGSDRSDAAQTPAQRGEYLVKHVAACGDCHTPRKMDGSLDMTKWLAGAFFADIDPASPTHGAIHAKNLTPHATGLGTWDATQIKQAFLEGVSKDGSPLFPVMPYYVLHNMTDADADAIVAYLKTIPAVDNAVPARQPLGIPFTLPAQPVPTAYIPSTTLAPTDPNYASAQRGKYLAGNIGVCMECHTDAAMMSPIPIDVTKLFQGKRAFPSAELGLPVPPFPATIFSRNLTPHANGIGGWTAAMVRTALKQGTDKDMVPLCPPMPAGPMQAFGGLTDEDALDIGNYLVSLAPKDNGVIPNCVPPGPPPGDGGMSSEGGGSDATPTSDAPAASDAASSDATGQ